MQRFFNLQNKPIASHQIKEQNVGSLIIMYSYNYKDGKALVSGLELESNGLHIGPRALLQWIAHQTCESIFALGNLEMATGPVTFGNDQR
jgi:hypothetical protein